MKTTKEILGLRIISIADGTQVGHVKDLLLNAQGGFLEFVIIDQPNDYFGAKVIAFSDILGIGEFALTIPNPQVIQAVGQIPAAEELLRQDVRVIGTKVLTKKGQLIGEVDEIFIDETSGQIARCSYRTADGEMSEVTGDNVITFGKELLIVENQPEKANPGNLQVGKQNEVSGSASASATQEAEEEKDSLASEGDDSFNLFEQRQLQYFIGKVTEKDIVLDDGEILPAGVPITEATIQKIKRRSTLMEITSHLYKH